MLHKYLHVKQVFVKYNTMIPLGMYRISLFQIQPEPDLAAGFVNSNPAGVVLC